ncbi:hypothetical protein M8J76_001264 [Diaphorina citri]|nr:hypothetical protein M8J76_001264 [Diaphorina citri]
MLFPFCILLLVTARVAQKTIPESASESPNKHNEHYHINKINTMADDDRTVQHTEDISDYMNEERNDYDHDSEPEYDENYDNEEEASEEEPQNQNKVMDVSKGAAQGENNDKTVGNQGNGRYNISNNDMKWFNKPANPSNPNQSPPQRYDTQSGPILSIISKTNGPSPNEGEVKNHSNAHSRIKNIKENANRLKDEKIIYEDEKFLLLKFHLAPLNDSDGDVVLNTGAEDMDNFEQDFYRGKSKDLNGLFDTSLFEDDSLFDEFDDPRRRKIYPGKPVSNVNRAAQARNPITNRNHQYREGNRKDSIPHARYLGRSPYPPNTRGYTSSRPKGFWIGTKYYPYHGPGYEDPNGKPSYHFGHKHHSFDFSEEDYSDFSSCGGDYDDEESDEGDTGILYGKPGPGVVGSSPGPGTGNGKPGTGTVIIVTSRGIPGTGNGKPETGPGIEIPGDTGILYGTPGPGVVVNPGNPGIDNGNPGTGPGIPENGIPGDTGILYGNSGPGIVVNPGTPGTGNGKPGTGTRIPGTPPGNNTDVVLVVIATQ